MSESRLTDAEIDGYIKDGTLAPEQGDLMKGMTGDKQALFAAKLVADVLIDKLGRGWG